ncbi:MAG: hypothetical protein ABFC67_06470 [Mizugakiibacter sp.]|uniref:hypothetical protein n=1 Tax=Rhodanobacteraceae TaxID=1775411 RepID=UPI0029669AE7|nr:hypothetical protein [Rhodanobacter sp. KK11]MCE5232263.1 hypothetical protein [Xanthomonadaceae bacterium]MDW2982417.1 hypothetical protein [Rhodanobacter sp. KK11]
MPQQEKLDALYRLLQEMTLCVRKDVVSTSTRWTERIEKTLMLAFITAMIGLAITAVWYRLASNKPLHGVPEPIKVIYLVGMLLAALYMITIIISLASMLWRHRRERFAAVLRPLKKDLSQDLDFLLQLGDFDKPTLTYGLVQYRHHYGVSDGRVAMLVGDIRKIGLFPALMAVAVAAAALLKASGSNPFLWAPLILAGCFYLVSVVVIGQRERASQVVALLEYAVDQANQPETMGPALNVGHDERVSSVQQQGSVIAERSTNTNAAALQVAP